MKKLIALMMMLGCTLYGAVGFVVDKDDGIVNVPNVATTSQLATKAGINAEGVTNASAWRAAIGVGTNGTAETDPIYTAASGTIFTAISNKADLDGGNLTNMVSVLSTNRFTISGATNGYEELNGDFYYSGMQDSYPKFTNSIGALQWNESWYFYGDTLNEPVSGETTNFYPWDAVPLTDAGTWVQGAESVPANGEFRTVLDVYSKAEVDGLALGSTNGMTQLAGDARYGGSNAVAAVVSPNGIITYHTTIQSAAQSMGNNCSLIGLRGFESVTGVVFQADNAIYNFNGIPMQFNTTTDSSFGGSFGRYETAIRFIGTNCIVNDLLVNQYIHSLYPTNANAYTLDYATNAFDFVFNDCVIQMTDMHTNSAAATSKTIADSGYRTKFNRGAVIMYSAVTNLPGYNVTYVNHQAVNGGTNTTFNGTKFIQNIYSSPSGQSPYAFMGGTNITIQSNMFIGCSYNRFRAIDAGTSVSYYNFDALSLDAVQNTVFPLTQSLFTSNDCLTATQGVYAVRSAMRQEIALPATNTAGRTLVRDQQNNLIGTNDGAAIAYQIDSLNINFIEDGSGIDNRGTWKKVIANFGSKIGIKSVLIHPVDSTFNSSVIMDIKSYNSTIGNCAAYAFKFNQLVSGVTNIYANSATVNFPSTCTTNEIGLPPHHLTMIVTNDVASVTAGDVLVVGSWKYTVDATTNNASIIRIREVLSTSTTWPTNTAAISNQTSGLVLTAQYGSNNIPAFVSGAGIFRASDGFHWMERNSSCTINAEIMSYR